LAADGREEAGPAAGGAEAVERRPVGPPGLVALHRATLAYLWALRQAAAEVVAMGPDGDGLREEVSLALSPDIPGSLLRVAGQVRRPDRVAVRFRGLVYELDLAGCRRALVERQVAGAGLDSFSALAQAAGRSRSAVSRFFAGKQSSLAGTLAILRALGLSFDDVLSRRGGGG
jgi:hypothetical protein